MTFASRMTRTPRPFNPERGAEGAALFPMLPPETRALIEGTAGCSPYLRGLLAKETDWIAEAVSDPEGALAAEFDWLRATAPDQRSGALRQGKRRVALLTALADLGGVWTLEEVTGALTDFAGLATHLAMTACVGAEIRRGKLPGMTEDDVELAGGMVALAMGKMGAGELNYSSDIDLICLFDETKYSRDDYLDARAALIRATRKMCAMLSDNTADGYVFRTDLRLRPDSGVTPVCMPMEAAERYYESLGRTWERAAYIKAYPCAGDIDAGLGFLKTLTPFVWRKHLDFAAIQDAHDMRLAIRNHKGLHGPVSLPGHNMKLGRGGIREIEFFTQTRQLIAGGRDPELRVRGTVSGLQVLAQKGWITPDVADTLTSHYRFHREVEHRLQMVNDAQTHTLPTAPEELDRIAAMMDMDTPALEQELRDRLSAVHDLTEDFFAPDAPSKPCEEAATLDHEIVERWKTYPALRSARAVEIFERLKPEILTKLSASPKPDEAMIAFDGFLSGLPAGVQLFSLFEANPHLVDLIVDIASTAQALARYLSRNAGVLDGVIGGSFFDPWPGREALSQELTSRLQAAEGDYERQLDDTRRWTKEWHFRIGVHLLRGLISAEEAGREYADLAAATLAGLFPAVQTEFARKHGPAPGRGAAVLGMGSLGACMQTATSDLDVIVIYDPEGAEESTGKRPLHVRTYFARLTQALVTAMTAPMSEGRLYEMDMRLRPSGNQGPVATSWDAFQIYQKTEAWTWEHLALTRAAVVVGGAGLSEDIEAFRQELIAKERDEGAVLRDVADMRARIRAAKTPASLWDVKVGDGRMQDIELFAQAATLLSGQANRSVADGLTAACSLGWMTDAEARSLCQIYRQLWQVQVATRLLGDGRLEPAKIGSGGEQFLLSVCDCQNMPQLEQRLSEGYVTAAKHIDAVLAARAKDAPA
ncbi:glutamine-synthetase adenylyltransferase [Donghicola eburneus]|uniref:Putative glutamine-synthetase adenylyltransferase n=1 Tax=Donghicola eburneus TaxID=393278 RepID=A0A1M4N2X5_9RHOB|nr:glutamine-synthetase adenylyltransferase [Donghicola eburneus]SCM68368.1 putative glutamine-synthetase adenylyltransferase [Donghicola eburneus]SFQ22651.1 glutamate-ammonia-ligase adenylyltransferase [Donghicola eburneus]